ncbi:MAG: uroporphyrinogen-III synthase [Rubellimicrobium sp.]|nr:uroporphyrinogen-III synthase [Rubellimicrobium sp.]
MTTTGPVLLLTRPRASSERFLAALRPPAQVQVVISPVIGIDWLEPPATRAPPGAVVLTSEHGAVAAGRIGLPEGMTAYCVGDRTAEVAAEQGFVPVSAGGDAEDLLWLILTQTDRAPFLHLRGDHARGDIVARLRAHGLEAHEHVAYRQRPLFLTSAARAALSGQVPVVVPLFSPRSARLLVQQGPFAAPVHAVAISKATADEAAELGAFQTEIARRPDGEAMTEAITTVLEALCAAGPA